MSRTLVVCSDCPFPANHGGRLDILQRIKSLVEIGEVVDLVITHKEPVSEDSKKYLRELCEHVIFIRRSSSLKSFIKSILMLMPFQMASRSSLKYVELSNKYNNLICESEYVHLILKNKSLHARKKLLRIHNDEGVYFKALGNDENKLSKKLYYYCESLLFRYNDKKIKSKYDLLLNISSEEYEKNKHKYNSIWLPPYMPVKLAFNRKKFSTYKNGIIFVGNLFMPNNVNGIIWYLNNIHVNLLAIKPNVVLTIAGNAKNGISDELIKSINRYPKNSIRLVESPSDGELTKLYEMNSVFINPMLNGAGVKLKNLDAMRHSFYVISTTIGMEGTGVTHNLNTIVANTPEEFLKALLAYYNCENDSNEVIALNAYQHIQDKFETKVILKNIM